MVTVRGRAFPLLLVLAFLAPSASAHDRLDASGLDGPGTFQVGWRLVETAHRFEGRLDEGGSRSLRLGVAQENVTDIGFVLRWDETDDPTGLSQSDLFELAVNSPAGEPAAGSPDRGRTGVLRASSGVLSALPQPVEVEASSLEDARARLEQYRGSLGMGDWSVVVRLADAGNPKGAAVDEGNSYVLTVTVRHYEAVLTRVVSLGPTPSLTVVEAARAAPPAWVWATGILSAAAVTLGGFLVRDSLRRRDD